MKTNSDFAEVLKHYFNVPFLQQEDGRFISILPIAEGCLAWVKFSSFTISDFDEWGYGCPAIKYDKHAQFACLSGENPPAYIFDGGLGVGYLFGYEGEEYESVNASEWLKDNQPNDWFTQKELLDQIDQEFEKLLESKRAEEIEAAQRSLAAALEVGLVEDPESPGIVTMPGHPWRFNTQKLFLDAAAWRSAQVRASKIAGLQQKAMIIYGDYEDRLCPSFISFAKQWIKYRLRSNPKRVFNVEVDSLPLTLRSGNPRPIKKNHQ